MSQYVFKSFFNFDTEWTFVKVHEKYEGMLEPLKKFSEMELQIFISIHENFKNGEHLFRFAKFVSLDWLSSYSATYV